MANPETPSRHALDGYSSTCRTDREPGPHTSAPAPYPGLEASHLSSIGHSQPTAGRASAPPAGGHELQSAAVSRDASQTSPSPTPQSPTMTSSVQATTTGVRQAYPNVYSEPHPWQRWRYYDPSRLRQPSSHLQSSSLFSSSPLSGPHPQAAADPVLEPLLVSLRALQSQFTVFQENLGDINSDVKDVLSELHALRTAQNKTDMRLAQLEDVTSTGTKARGLGRWARVRRNRGGRADTRIDPLLDADGADVAIVPETLVQSMTSIQSAVEELLARERRASRSHLPVARDTSTSTPRCLPSMDLTGLESSHTSSPLQSIIGPSQQLSASQFVPRTLSASQSELSPPLSSIATPTSEFDTLPSRMAAGKGYADVSIQAYSPSPASELSSDFPHGNMPGFTPVDWGVDPVTTAQPDRNFQRVTHFPCDARLPGAIDTVVDRDCNCPLRGSTVSHAQSPTRTMSSLPCSEMLHAQSESTILPASSSSPDTLVIPTAVGPITVSDPLLSPERTSTQSSSLQAPLTSEIVDGLPRTRHSSSGSRLSVGSSLSSLTSVGDTPELAPDTSVPVGQPHAELDIGITRMTSDMTNGAVSVTGGVDVHVPEPILVAVEGSLPSTPVEADKEVSLSGLPTPQSEAFTPGRGRPRAVNHSACEHGVSTDLQLGLCAHLVQSFSAVPTRSSCAPESVQKDRGTLPGVRQGSARQELLGAFSQSVSPLTPPPLSPRLVIGSSGKGAASVSRGHGVSGKPTDSSGNSEGTAVFGDADTRVAVDVEMSPSAVDSGVPVLAVSSGPPRSNVVSDDVSSPAPQVAGDPDLFMTPESSLRQHNIELPDCNPDADGIAPVCSQLDKYFRFSSPWCRYSPSTSAAVPRYATPSDSSDSPLIQEEDEVWDTLMFGASGISTPVVDTAALPLVYSRRPSRPSSVPRTSQQPPTSTSTSALELFSVDPSMLHDAPLPRGSELQRLQRDRNGSLSSLTSLDEDNVIIERLSKQPRVDEHDRGPRGGRRSELRRVSPPSRAPGKSGTVVSAGRVVSDATNADERLGSRLLGGPGASLDELVLLARREPLKIRLKVPEKMRSSKRKRDAVDREDAVAGEEKDSTVGERVRPGAGTRVEDASQQGQAEVASKTVPHPRIEAGTLAPSRPKLAATGPAPKSSKSGGSTVARERSDAMPHASVPRKESRKRNEHCEKNAPATCTTSPNASVHQKNSKRGLKVKRKSPIKYHVWNGQIVTVELEPTPTSSSVLTSELQPHSPVTPSTSQPAIRAKEASQNLRTPARPPRRREGENEAIGSPLSSPVSHRSARHTRFADPSPTKEDVWNDIHDDSREWPELPETFGHWDIQFIQCDNCDKWYHYGCVAIKAGDPRLEPSAVFICPKCHNQSARRQTLRHHDDVCARPDCPEPQITGDSETYYVEKLVGRKQMEGYIYMWLAKWEGYPMSQATWIPKENVLGDGTRLFNTFLEDALGEGADLSDHLILLQEAIEAGWEEK